MKEICNIIKTENLDSEENAITSFSSKYRHVYQCCKRVLTQKALQSMKNNEKTTAIESNYDFLTYDFEGRSYILIWFGSPLARDVITDYIDSIIPRILTPFESLAEVDNPELCKF